MILFENHINKCEIYIIYTKNMFIKKNAGKTYTHVCHIADIHIRVSSDRNEEYLLVFERLYADLLKLKNQGINAIIVVAGDIMDNKSKTTTESIDICGNFFKSLADIYPTIITIGNHDMIGGNGIETTRPSSMYGHLNKDNNFNY